MSQKRQIYDSLLAPQDVLEIILVVIARSLLGLFLSSVMGMLIYVATVPVVQSIWELREINAALVAVLVFGIASGVGSFLAWLDRDISRTAIVLMLFLSVTAALLGAWGGLHNSRDAYKLLGLPGIPALTGIIYGAVLAGNIFNSAIGVFRKACNPRLR